MRTDRVLNSDSSSEQAGCAEPQNSGGARLRRLAVIALLLSSAVMEVGCALPMWSPNRERRAKQQIFQSENLRHVPNIWERLWNLDTPDFATPYRTHGGII